MIAGINLLNTAGINVDFRIVQKEAYVPRAKNKAVKMMVENARSEALIIVDYDLGFDKTALARLIIAEELVVSGSFPYKEGEGFPTSLCGKELNGNGLIESTDVTSGFTYYHRDVFERMDRHCDIQESDGLKYYFDTGFLFSDNRWYGEDRCLCRRLAQCGIRMWVDPNIYFTHVGVTAKSANHLEYLNDSK